MLSLILLQSFIVMIFTVKCFVCSYTYWRLTFLPMKALIYIHSIVRILKHIPASNRELMSEVCSLVSHTSVMPATNAVSEQSFSSLRRVKNYLRSTMTENSLNSVMLLHIHKERTDSLSLIDVANDLIQGTDHGLLYLEHLLILMCIFILLIATLIVVNYIFMYFIKLQV